jgi:putative nucleotidyltransferase with HDIG domain
MTNSKLRLNRLMFSMASLVDLGQEVTSSKGMAEKMKSALYVVTGMFSVPTAVLFTYNANRRKLEPLVQKGQKDRGRQIVLSVQPDQVKDFRPNEPHRICESQPNAFFELNRAEISKLQARIFIPLFARNEFVGALALGKKLSRAAYRQSDKDILRVVAHQLAITLHNAKLFSERTKKAAENKRLYESMRRIYHDTIQAFSAAIDAKDEYTKDHSYRVASYAVAIARELGWKKKDLEAIYVAGLLHDIGKIIVDSKVIRKGTELTPVEIDEIKRHPQVSYRILSKIKFPWKNVERFVLHHHERLDGKGYPHSLCAPELSEGVKILALADAFDAMTTDRPYREKLGIEEAMCEVMKCSGTQFDKKITTTFYNLLRKELNGDIKEPRIVPLLENINADSVNAYRSVCSVKSDTRLPQQHPQNTVLVS